MKYKYKPIIIDAIQYKGDNKEEIMSFTEGGKPLSGSILQCAVGLIIGKNDWIIKENNKYFLCTSKVFEELFEIVN